MVLYRLMLENMQLKCYYFYSHPDDAADAVAMEMEEADRLSTPQDSPNKTFELEAAESEG